MSATKAAALSGRTALESVKIGNMPADWETARIGDKFTFTVKPRGLDFDAQRIAFVPMSLLPYGRLRFSDFEMRDWAEIASGTYFEEGDLLIPKITPCFENGKQGIALDVPGGRGFASTEVIPVKQIEGVSHLPFLAMYLLHPDVRSSLAGKMEGATGRQRLAKNALADWVMPFPPLSEQRAIVAILSKIQAAAEAQGNIVAKLKELKTATVSKLFREGLRGEKSAKTDIGGFPESWDIVPLGKHCHFGSGGTPARENPRYWNGTIPWVKTGEIDYRPIAETEEQITAQGLANSSAKIFKRGSVLMAMYGQGVTRGKVAILEIDAATNQACAALVPDQSLDSGFLYTYCMFAYERIRELGHGANQKNLSADILKQMLIPIPKNLEEQREIAAIIKTLESATTFAETRRCSMEALFSSALNLLIAGKVRIHEA